MRKMTKLKTKPILNNELTSIMANIFSCKNIIKTKNAGVNNPTVNPNQNLSNLFTENSMCLIYLLNDGQLNQTGWELLK